MSGRLHGCWFRSRTKSNGPATLNRGAGPVVGGSARHAWLLPMMNCRERRESPVAAKKSDCGRVRCRISGSERAFKEKVSVGRTGLDGDGNLDERRSVGDAHSRQPVVRVRDAADAGAWSTFVEFMRRSCTDSGAAEVLRRRRGGSDTGRDGGSRTIDPSVRISTGTRPVSGLAALDRAPVACSGSSTAVPCAARNTAGPSPRSADDHTPDADCNDSFSSAQCSRSP